MHCIALPSGLLALGLGEAASGAAEARDSTSSLTARKTELLWDCRRWRAGDEHEGIWHCGLVARHSRTPLPSSLRQRTDLRERFTQLSMWESGECKGSCFCG
jgi:hypothetical protein